MKIIKAGAIATAVLIASCGGGSGSGSQSKELISPADADAVTDALLVKVNGSSPVNKDGEIPLATTSGAEPSISNLLDKVTVQNGQKVTLQAQVDSSSALALLFSKVTGADSYFEFDIALSTKAANALEIEVTIPENIRDGEFCQQFSAQDDAGRTSQAVEVCFEVESSADDGGQTQPAAAFSSSFIAGTTFSVSTDGDVERFVFNSDGTGSVSFAPNADNGFSTDDQNPIVWSIDSSGRLLFTETDGSGDEYNWVLEATSLSNNAAEFIVTVTTANETFTGTGSMQVESAPTSPSPSPSVSPTPTQAAAAFTSPFIAGKTFSVSTDGDVDRFVFNADGSGFVRFAPNADNDFSTDDQNPIIWSIDSSGRLLFTETDSGGDEYNWVLEATSLSNNAAEFIVTVTTANETFTGTGNMQVESAPATPDPSDSPTPTSSPTGVAATPTATPTPATSSTPAPTAPPSTGPSPTPSSTPTPVPTGTSIVSTWRAQRPSNELLLFTFFQDGTYVHAEVDDQPDDPSGMERGTYSRDPDTGITSVATTFDQNRARGISDLDGTSNMRATVVGDVLTLEFDEDGNGSFDSSIDFQREVSSGVLGTWLYDAGNSDFLMFIFFDDGTYIHGEVDNEPDDPPGMERGLFQRDEATGLTSVNLTFDANGARGISDLDGTSNRLRMSLENGQLLLEFDEDGNGSFESSLRLDRQ